MPDKGGLAAAVPACNYDEFTFSNVKAHLIQRRGPVRVSVTQIADIYHADRPGSLLLM